MRVYLAYKTIFTKTGTGQLRLLPKLNATMEAPNVQVRFFQHLKALLPPHMAIVDEVADLLGISNDSAYRRIRGEKPIDLEETFKLCNHFKVSMDQLLHLQSDAIIFMGKSIDHRNFSLDLYLRSILHQLELINSFERKELLYLNRDIPIFHYFHFYGLAAFKIFFWMKSLMQYPYLNKSLFVMDEFMESLQKTGEKIIAVYNKIPSREIWNLENVNSTIHQIEYYKNTRVFASAQDIINVYDFLQKTIDHIEMQTEAGYKFSVAGEPLHNRIPYRMYLNEFILGDNTNLAIMNDTKVVYLNHSLMNFIITKDPSFTEYTYQHFNNIIRKSSIISDVGEKERARFFNSMREKVDGRKKTVAHYR